MGEKRGGTWIADVEALRGSPVHLCEEAAAHLRGPLGTKVPAFEEAASDLASSVSKSSVFS